MISTSTKFKSVVPYFEYGRSQKRPFLKHFLERKLSEHMNSMFLFFEVMGEFPTVAQIWGFFAITGIGGFLLVRRHPAFLFIILSIVLLVSANHFIDIYSDLYYDIMREAGYSYIMQSYAVAFGSIIIPCLGIITWFKRRKDSNSLVSPLFKTSRTT